jgi:hypothetical protein|tara:strand:+ start:196 stop:309 length:114 start_codon:yes stop_codon:yes gene_type:complete
MALTNVNRWDKANIRRGYLLELLIINIFDVINWVREF